ncbi:MAG: hypothetical protein AAGI68_14260 [Planctomycetota bacterium]
MSVRGRQLAAAVAALLNTETWPVAFTAFETPLPQAQLHELTELRVTTTAGPCVMDRATRDSVDRELLVQVGLQQKVTPTDTDTIGQLNDLTEAIAEFLALTRLEDPEASVVGLGSVPNADPMDLRKRGLYTASIEPVYELLSF